MITVSQDYKDALAADNRNFYCVADITLWNGTTLSVDNTNIWQGGFQIKQAVSGQSAFEIGACVINEFKLILNNIGGAYDSYDFYGAEITASFGLYDSDGTLIDMDGNGNTTIQKGIYYVDEVESNGTLITLTCLDAMVKFDRNFSDVSITYPSTLQNIVQKICQKCGVPYSMVAFHNSIYSVTTAPDDTTLTCRDVLTMVCQIACANGTIDRFGEFTIDWSDTGFMRTIAPVDGDLDGGSFWADVDSADGGSFWDLSDTHDSGTFETTFTPDYALSGFFKFNRDHADVRISGVKLTQNSITYLAGSDRYIVEIQSNALINAGDEATILSDIASRIIGCGMRAFSANHLADPTLEAGDTVTLTDHMGNTYRSVVTDTEFSAGEQQRTDCDAESYVSNQSIRYSSASKAIADYNVSSASSLVANAYGLYKSSITNPQSSGTTEAVHNASTFETSTFAMIKNENGLQTGTRATTSDPWTWTATDAAEGAGLQEVLDVVGINADWIRVGTMSANRILGGELKLGGQDNGNGIAKIYDDSGNLAVTLNKTGMVIDRAYTFYASDYTAADVTTIQNILLGTVTPTAAQINKYDLNGDGLITAVDLSRVNKLVTGVESSYTINAGLVVGSTSSATIIETSGVHIRPGGLFADNGGFSVLAVDLMQPVSTTSTNGIHVNGKFDVGGQLFVQNAELSPRMNIWQTGNRYLTGFTTTGSRDICFFIPSSRPIKATSARVTSMSVTVRQNGGYPFARSGASGGTYTQLGSASIQIWNNSASYRTNEVETIAVGVNEDGVNCYIRFVYAPVTTSGGSTAISNNAPLGINVNATIVFS